MKKVILLLICSLILQMGRAVHPPPAFPLLRLHLEKKQSKNPPRSEKQINLVAKIAIAIVGIFLAL